MDEIIVHYNLFKAKEQDKIMVKMVIGGLKTKALRKNGYKKPHCNLRKAIVYSQ